MVKVMTDSAACISPQLAQKHNISVIPAALIHYNGQTFIDNVTITNEEAYNLIEKDGDRFTTAAISPELVIEEFNKLIKDHKEILHIAISDQLSAGYKTSSLAAQTVMQENPGVRIRVADSKAAAASEALVVIAAAKAAATGMNLDKLAELVPVIRDQVGGIMMWDTIRYVYRTGRMSKMKARLAALLNIKPISRLSNEGSLELVERVKKREEGYQKIIDMIKADVKTRSLHFMIMHSASPEWAEEFKTLLQKEFDCLDINIGEYSPVLGYATGRGALFVGYHPELQIPG